MVEVNIAEALSGVRIQYDPKPFFPDNTFSSTKLADHIMQDYNFITLKDSHEILWYNNGIYCPYGKELIMHETEKRLGEQFTIRRMNECIARIETRTLIERESVNANHNVIVCLNGNID